MTDEKEYLYDVFLGGSCGSTTWRNDYVIPFLKNAEISYYNPQRTTWTEDMIKTEERAKQNSRILLFVIDSSQPSLISLIEIAFLAARNAPLVVVLPPEGELSVGPIKDPKYDRLSAFVFLHKVLCRHSIPVYRQINDALRIMHDRIREIKLKSPRQPPKSLVYRLMTKVKSCIFCFVACVLVLPLYKYRKHTKEGSKFLPLTRTECCQALTLLSFSLIAQLCFSYISQLIFADSSVIYRCTYWLCMEFVLARVILMLYCRLKPKDNPERPVKRRLKKVKPSMYSSEVYLIGCGTNYNWMRYNVIPQLNKNKVTYYDSYLQEFERRVLMIKNCSMILLVIASVDNLFSGIVELAYYTGTGNRIIGCFLLDVPILSRQPLIPLNDYYRRGIMYLKDMAETDDLTLVPDLQLAIDQAIFEILNVSDDLSDNDD